MTRSILPVLALSAFAGSAYAVPLATFSIDGIDPAARIAAGNAVGPSSTASGVSVTNGITGISAAATDRSLVAATNAGVQDATFRGPLPGTPGNASLANGLIAFGIPEQDRNASNTNTNLNINNRLQPVLDSGNGLSFTVTADTGFELDLDGGSVTFDYFTGSPGSQATSVALFSSVDGFVTAGAAVEAITAIPSGNVSPSTYSSVQPLSFDFDGTRFNDLQGDVDFRLVFYDVQFNLLGNNNRRFNTVNNLVLSGEVAVVPEPASLALLAAGGVLLLGRGCRQG